MTTGEKIAVQRKKLQLTQIQLAEELGVTRQAVSRWEGDIAFPETDTLIKMSRLFGCTVDYLLNYNGAEPEEGEIPRRGALGGEGGEGDYTQSNEADGGTFRAHVQWSFDLRALSFEYKSKTHIGSLPLVHVNWGLGRTAKGVFAFGFKSVGIFSFGIFSLGLVSFGIFALGLLGLGVFALGLLSAATIAVGLIALGAVALGLYSMGAVSVGLFACGAYACGYYVAIGDVAVGGIALGKTSANGSVLSVLQQDFKLYRDIVHEKLNEVPAFWRVFTEWCRGIFESMANGALNIKVKI